MSHDLRLERVYDAAPEVVFDGFTDPDAQKELYADAPDWVVESEIDLRVGGRWTIVFGPPGRPGGPRDRRGPRRRRRGARRPGRAGRRSRGSGR
jgi:uncharacterized protein YndB with AHSA1/START domain